MSRLLRWLLPVVVAIGLAWWALQPPGPRERGGFSGERAVAELAAVIDGVGPHPVGSPGSAVVRSRIQGRLAALGHEVEVQDRVVCGQHCARVRNLLVPIEGQSDRWVVVATHTDSVASGPGAGDAGAAVGSMLELARIWSFEPPPTNVLLLFGDGEEAGLLGAQAFMTSPWAQRIHALVNLEARGTEGGAYLFELHGNAPRIVGAYARHATAPSVSSLYTAIYDFLPNNTDVTIFAGLGVPSANIAFLGGGDRYHTPFDDLDRLSTASVQQLGEQGLSLVHALAEVDEPGAEQGAVFFDVLGWFVCVLPVWAVQTVGCLGLGWALAGIRGTSRWAVLRGIGRWLAMVVGSVAVCSLVHVALHGLGVRFESHGVWVVVGSVASVLAFGQGLTGLLEMSEEESWRVAGLVHAVLAVAMAFGLPAGGYLWVWTTLALLLGAEIRTIRPVALGLALYPWVHVAVGLPIAVGVVGPVVGGAWALALGPLVLTWSADRRVGGVGVGLAVLAFGMASVLPDSSPSGVMVRELTLGNQAWRGVTSRRYPIPESESPLELQPATEPAPLNVGQFVGGSEPSDLPGARISRDSLRWTLDAPGASGFILPSGVTVRIEGQVTRRFHWVGAMDGLVVQLDRAPDWWVTVYPGVDGLELPEGVVPVHSGLETWIMERP